MVGIAHGEGTLDGTLAANTDSRGVASFTDLALRGGLGDRRLAFMATGFTGLVSGAVTLQPGVAAKLRLQVEPSPTTETGVVLPRQPVVHLEDHSGNPVTQSGVAVTASIAGSEGTLGGMPTATTDAGGVATFTDLSISDVKGELTLIFSAADMDGATSEPVTVTAAETVLEAEAEERQEAEAEERLEPEAEEKLEPETEERLEATKEEPEAKEEPDISPVPVPGGATDSPNGRPAIREPGVAKKTVRVRLPGLLVPRDDPGRASWFRRVFNRLRRELQPSTAEMKEEMEEATIPLEKGENRRATARHKKGKQQKGEKQPVTTPPRSKDVPPLLFVARGGASAVPKPNQIRFPELMEGETSPENEGGPISELPRSNDPVERATLQMLPGRLEPLNKHVVQQEVRFLRAPGETQEVTLGWDLGDPPRHIMLDHPSIQPRHARMVYQDGQWWIQSLSEYHPVEVNDVPLQISEEAIALKNGDQVRLGEAVFRFHMS
jgi:hypothetical protein